MKNWCSSESRILWRTHAGAEEECEMSYPWEEGVAEITYDELTTTPIPCPSVLLVGRK